MGEKHQSNEKYLLKLHKNAWNSQIINKGRGPRLTYMELKQLGRYRYKCIHPKI